MTKVLVINTSLRKKNGNTAALLKPFIEGMEGKGADVELVYTEKLNIKQCRGCFACWFKTPGVCSTLKGDDMKELLDKMCAADYWVFASPVYGGGVCSNMKIFLERTSPLMEPALHEASDPNEPCRHIRRANTGDAKIIFFSTAALTMEQFDPLLLHMEYYVRLVDRDFVGSIVRPMAGVFRRALNKGDINIDDVFNATKQAGEQLITKGEFSPETLKTISRDLVPVGVFRDMYNKNVDQAIANLGKRP
ncbi:MAG: iron-sulfur protein [SAR324 cluster bacterium]|uniref:Iron-sulfur protein n=1 Tax=SAR324 cluster bacterium TaxID=2024889 RepID=A0A2A4TBM4_9DELT|nr:MAG: iron-sulfur protein [SAR324 cluster bacterium]